VRIACTDRLGATSRFRPDVVSWHDLASASAGWGFDRLLGACVVRSLVLLDRADADLDQERALHQIPAMNSAMQFRLDELDELNLPRAVEAGLQLLHGSGR